MKSNGGTVKNRNSDSVKSFLLILKIFLQIKSIRAFSIEDATGCWLSYIKGLILSLKKKFSWLKSSEITADDQKTKKK